jgi:hypothetical protein
MLRQIAELETRKNPTFRPRPERDRRGVFGDAEPTLVRQAEFIDETDALGVGWADR